MVKRFVYTQHVCSDHHQGVGFAPSIRKSSHLPTNLPKSCTNDGREALGFSKVCGWLEAFKSMQEFRFGKGGRHFCWCCNCVQQLHWFPWLTRHHHGRVYVAALSLINSSIVRYCEQIQVDEYRNQVLYYQMFEAMEYPFCTKTCVPYLCIF